MANDEECVCSNHVKEHSVKQREEQAVESFLVQWCEYRKVALNNVRIEMSH